MPVDAGTVEWLKEGAVFEPATDSGIAAAWGAEAVETTITSTLALQADAAIEAPRQQAFLEGPLAPERHVVPGLWSSLIGRPITLTIASLGYDAGLDVFVIDADEHEVVELTTLTVLRRLT